MNERMCVFVAVFTQSPPETGDITAVLICRLTGVGAGEPSQD